jgi:hypothetical protein
MLTTSNTYHDEHMFIPMNKELSLIETEWIGLPSKHFMATFNENHQRIATSTGMVLVQDVGVKTLFMHPLICATTATVMLLTM